ncbi:MAG: ECF transporter S component [Clostridiales bacterium]|nr:ECF transporter S component [Clostridiales bacterium]
MDNKALNAENKINSGQERVKWTTRDLIVLASISAVFAIVLSGLSYFFVMFIIPLGPVVRSIGSCLWFMPATFIAYIFRRPGAVLLSQLIVRTISVPISAYAWLEIPGGFVVGGGVELILFLTRYSKFNLPVLMLSGAMAGVFRIIARWIPLGINYLTIEMQIAFIVVSLTSGALSGWMGIALAEAVAKSGVLSNYAVGQRFQEEI